MEIVNTITLDEQPVDVKLLEGNTITHQQNEDGSWVPYRGSRVLTMDHWQWAEYRDHIVARIMKRECPCCKGQPTQMISPGRAPVVCRACGGTGNIPALVLAALMRYARQHQNDDHGCPSAMELVDQLKWHLDHFSFERAGMYHGVELSGHIHT
jgi:hypothetical protein